MIDHYQILGIKRDATRAEIKKAYRQLMLIHHPDKNTDKENDTAKKVIAAYEVLSDDVKRQQYDNAFLLDSLDEDNRVCKNFCVTAIAT